MSNKSLLKLETQSQDRKTQMVINLLNSNGQKPWLKQQQESKVLDSLKQFLPLFKKDTDELVNNSELKQQKQLDNNIVDTRFTKKSRYQKMKLKQKKNQCKHKVDGVSHKTIGKKPYINMNLMGVFDIKEKEEKQLVQEME